MSAGGKGGGKQQVTDYKLSLHIGVSTAADELTGIYVDDKTAWEGSVSTLTDIDINLPNLNGGPKESGGLIGTATYLPGDVAQLVPDQLAQRWGLTGATSPAYRGLATIMFTGRGRNGPFTWSTNNPIVAQKVSARVKRMAKGLDPTLALITYTINVVTVTHTITDGNTSYTTQTKYIEGTDPGVTIYENDTQVTTPTTVNTTNPAHIVYEVLTDTAQGMGESPAAINISSFTAAAQTLFNENTGISIKWSEQQRGEDFINDVLAHVNGVLFLDPKTGLWNLKLLRADYDITTAPIYSPDNATLTSFSRKLWGETINEIQVTWTNPVNEQQETVTVQDLANIAIQGGIVSDSRDYSGIRTSSKATELGMRDLRTAVAPLRGAEMKIDRSAWDRNPGDIVILNWPEYRVQQIVMRVGKIDYGKAGDPSIKVSLLEDIFGLQQAIITPAPGSAWATTSTPPTPLDSAVIITLPAYFTLTAAVQSAYIALEYPEVLAAAFGYKQNRDTGAYDLLGEVSDPAGTVSFTDVGTKTIVERATLAVALVAEAVSTFSDAIVVAQDRGPQVGQFAFIGNTDADFEIVLLSACDTNNTWTIQRGVLDTVPSPWAVGTPIWFLNAGARVVDEKVIRSAGEAVEYEFLTRTSQGLMDPSLATPLSQTLTARPHLPLRPGNVKVNGVGFGTVSVGSATTLTVTWATRNRLLEDGQVVLWTDGPVAPEYQQATVVTVTDGSGDILYTQGGLWTANELDLQAAWFARWTDIYITVSAGMTDLASLHSYTIHVTGLPGNAGAAPPPAPAAITDAPSPAPAPALNAWVAIGTTVSSGSSQLPAIQIGGVRDNSAATGLVVRYRVTGSSEWTVHPAFAIGPYEFIGYITAVVANVSYDVQVAYQLTYGTNGLILSQWEPLSTVTTGNSVLSNLNGSVYFDFGSGLFVRSNGTFMAVSGLGFGANNDLVDWTGPTMPVTELTTTNGYTYSDHNGNSGRGTAVQP